MPVCAYWSPVITSRQYIGDGKIRDILGREFQYPCVLSFKDIPFLRGVYACGYSEVNELINAIGQYGEIELTLAG